MWITTRTILCLLLQNTMGINLVDLPDSESEYDVKKFVGRRMLVSKSNKMIATPAQTANQWVFRQGDDSGTTSKYEDEKDANIKKKISTLVEQTLHDTNRKITSVQYLKEKHRQEAPYKVGFILSRVKKAREVLNELFNVAVKHRDSWKALEQLKIFELIVHTNVDITNLVRLLVEIHLQHLNSTTFLREKKRVVLF